MPVPERPSVEGYEHLLAVYRQLSRFRRVDMNGPGPIAPGDILDWMRLTGEQLSGEEIDVIQHMDAAFLSARNVDNQQVTK